MDGLVTAKGGEPSEKQQSSKKVVLSVPKGYYDMTEDEQKAWADAMATRLQEQLRH